MDFLTNNIYYWVKSLKRLTLLGLFLLKGFDTRAQSYFLYGTNTLAESTINPSVQVFDNKKDCKKIAFNFFIPHLGLDVSTFGPISKFIYVNNSINKIDSGYYTQNPNQTNYATSHEDLHLLSLKILNHRKNSSEFLVDYSVRGTGYAGLKNTIITLIPVLNQLFQGGNTSGLANNYTNIINTNSFYYGFSQLIVGYRQNINSDFSWGISGGYLSGIFGAKLKITTSTLTINPQEISFVSRGVVKINRPFTSDSSFTGLGSIRSYLPSTQNPGLVVSTGITYKLDYRSEISANLKDLGFIYWRSSKQYLIPDTVSYNSSTPFNLHTQTNKGFRSFYKDGGYTSYYSILPAYLEGMYSYTFSKFLRSTLVASKNILTPELDLIIINDIKYKDFHILINSGYNSLNTMRLGLHFLYQSSGFEAFVGTENLGPSLNLPNQINTTLSPGTSAALNFNFGMALRLGNCFKIQTATDMRPKGPGNFIQRIFQKKILPYDRNTI